ncbi:MAG: ComEC/Rec2 family competence protein, partial [Alphaproteobacteria bacterium]
NFVAVPLTGAWIMPWGILALALVPFGLERLALVPMGWGIELMIQVAESVAAWPGALVRTSAPPFATLALAALGGLWLCLWRGRWRLSGIAPIAAAAAIALFARPPDMLVSGDGRLIAVRAADGAVMLSSKRVARATAARWLARYGQAESAPWPEDGTSSDGRLSCDSLACIYRDLARTVAIVARAEAFEEECWAADVIVSVVPTPRRCPAARTVVDRFDLWREGAHALWFENGGVRIETVAARQGARPWRVLRGGDDEDDPP